MNDVMIDFETLGITPDAVVISIGAVFFNPFQLGLGPTFEARFDVQEQLDKSRAVSAETIKWWVNQSKEAGKVFNENPTPVAVVLSKLLAWMQVNCTNKKELRVWGNGSTFDISILENLLRQYKLEAPWGYNGVMDLRTFKRFVAKGAPVDKLGIEHNALDDAKSQALYVIKHATYNAVINVDNKPE